MDYSIQVLKEARSTNKFLITESVLKLQETNDSYYIARIEYIKNNIKQLDKSIEILSKVDLLNNGVLD
jgi:hypothetical protein